MYTYPRILVDELEACLGVTGLAQRLALSTKSILDAQLGARAVCECVYVYVSICMHI
jgi:hypothetical protein